MNCELYSTVPLFFSFFLFSQPSSSVSRFVPSSKQIYFCKTSKQGQKGGRKGGKKREWRVLQVNICVTANTRATTTKKQLFSDQPATYFVHTLTIPDCKPTFSPHRRRLSNQSINPITHSLTLYGQNSVLDLCSLLLHFLPIT